MQDFQLVENSDTKDSFFAENRSMPVDKKFHPSLVGNIFWHSRRQSNCCSQPDSRLEYAHTKYTPVALENTARVGIILAAKQEGRNHNPCGILLVGC